MTLYAGNAPLTNIVCAGRRMVGVLAGSPVPEDALPSEIERLLADGFIIESDGDGGINGADAAALSPKLGSGNGSVAVDYNDLKVDDLKAELERRNEGREDGAKVTPDSHKKADLIAALEVDDAAKVDA